MLIVHTYGVRVGMFTSRKLKCSQSSSPELQYITLASKGRVLQ